MNIKGKDLTLIWCAVFPRSEYAQAQTAPTFVSGWLPSARRLTIGLRQIFGPARKAGGPCLLSLGVERLALAQADEIRCGYLQERVI